ncbi:acyl-CoA thioesterase/BAAT N-terminal domain-containing protein [Nocardioides rotundus]|uniref:acyl-CoA thioesterase/bile acid-CoA:amino acid N-acyltransferase family protein n=1 Tax=Nocardioides rotundus TaxID=1774216 RepID=UPI001CC03B58|nr:acyl-CoA thioesterase/bile acid-CoA:amino acid N-acyltransferase family protein [Nocardioides rotundus]UAL29602.1 acyl-CoA thioesterase/BAAT N-terminal domain-containing protein [Nocardioides rotundus]
MLGVRPFVRSALCSVLLLLAACTVAGSPERDAAGRSATRVTGVPATALADEPLRLRVEQVPPQERVRVTVTTDGEGRGARSSAEFIAGPDGIVNLERDRPTSGSYSVASGFGLLWTLHDTADRSQTRVKIEIVVEVAGREIARLAQTRRLDRPGVRVERLTVKRNGVVGYLIQPSRRAQPAPGTGVVIIGGSERGFAAWAEARLLASHGYPTLLLAYHGEPGVPRRLERIPIEYFGRALKLMSTLPSVREAAVVPVGISRGGEAALLTAVHYPELAAGAVTVAGIGAAASAYPRDGEPAWTWRGRPLPFARSLRDLWIDPGPAVIDVWRIRGPLLLICGRADQVLSSCSAADSIARRLVARGRPTPEVAAFAEVGHEITAFAPGVIYPTRVSRPDALGLARERAWRQLLAYLEGLENRN